MSATVNEKSPLFLTLTFTDEVGAPLIPSTVDWRLDDLEQDLEIVGWTALVGPAASMTLTVPATNNIINDTTKVREARMLGIRINENLLLEAHEQRKYHVLNLFGPSGA